MSVWFTESFNTQLIRTIGRMKNVSEDRWVRVVAALDIEFWDVDFYDTLSDSRINRGAFRTSNMSDETARDLVAKHYTGVRKRKLYYRSGKVLNAVLDQANVVIGGLPGVYEIYKLHTLGKFCTKLPCADLFQKAALLTMSNAFNLGSHPDVAQNFCARIPANLEKEIRSWFGLAEVMKQFGYLAKSRKVHQKLSINSSLMKQVSSVADSGVIAITVGQRCVLMTEGDCGRLRQMALSKAYIMIAIHATDAANKNSHYSESVMPWLKKLDNDIMAATPYITQRLGKYYFKLHQINLGVLAGELAADSLEDMYKELVEVGIFPNRVRADYNQVIGLSFDLPPEVRLDCTEVHRMLPSPDFDVLASFSTRAGKLAGRDRTWKAPGFTISKDEFRQYMYRMLLKSAYDLHGEEYVRARCHAPNDPKAKAFLEDGTVQEGLDWVLLFDLQGMGKYFNEADESMKIWKDTAAAKETVSQCLHGDYRTNNMLARWLLDDNCPSVSSAKADFEGASEHVARAGFKMEPKKSANKARVFYIGNLRDRLIQSEWESNIERYAKAVAGYTLGQTPEIIYDTIHKAVCPALDADKKLFLLSADVSGWSADMDKDIQRLSHEVWAYFFGNDLMTKAHLMNEGALVLLDKEGYQHCVRANGANFEGYNGKEMTFLHLAVIGYALYKCKREKQYKIGKVRPAVFIDDAMLALEVPKNSYLKDVSEFVNAYSTLMAAMLGDIDVCKSYPSSTMGVFLNEVYYKGRKLCYGLRACMKIGLREGVEFETLPMALSSIQSAAGSAMSRGLHPMVTQFVAAIGSVYELDQWGIRKSPEVTAVFVHGPKTLGCCGAQGGYLASGSLGGMALAEGIRWLQMQVRTNLVGKSPVTKLLKQPIRVKTYAKAAEDPEIVKPARVSWGGNRIARLALEKLSTAYLSERASKIFGEGVVHGHSEDVWALLYQSSSAIAQHISEDFADAHPQAVVASIVQKLANARALVVLGCKKQISQARRAEVRTAKFMADSLEEYFE